MFQKKFVEKIKTLFFKSCHLWQSGKTMYSRRGRTIWRIAIACWWTKATDTKSEYVILFSPRQRLLREHASITFMRTLLVPLAVKTNYYNIRP